MKARWCSGEKAEVFCAEGPDPYKAARACINSAKEHNILFFALNVEVDESGELFTVTLLGY